LGTAQVTRVVLDGVTEAYNDTLLLAGAEHVFSLRATNIGSYVSYNPTNGFCIFSDDGAQWSYPYADTTIDTSITPNPTPPPVLDTTIDTDIIYARVDPAFRALFDKFFINHFGLTGSDVDTTGFGGVAMSVDRGIPDGWDALAYELIIQSRLEDHGKHICIDSTWYPPSNTWKWAPLNTAFPQIYPDWSGQQCFMVFNPVAPSNLVLSEDTLFFSALEGGSNPALQAFNVTSDGAPLYFTLYEDASWLIKSPAAGTTPKTITVSVNITGLAIGSYFDSIRVASDGAANSPQFLHVALEVAPPPPVIAVSSSQFFFNAIAGGDNPAPQTLVITNAGGQTLDWTVSNSESWLELAPLSGSDSGDVTVSVDITGLTYDIYHDTIVVSDTNAANSPVLIPVTLSVGSDLPIIEVDIPSMYIVTLSELIMFSRSFEVLNAGAGTMSFWVEEDSPEIMIVSPVSGTAPETVTLTFKITGVNDGDEHYDTVWVHSNEAINSPQLVYIHLRFVEHPAVIKINPDTVVLNQYECYQGALVFPPQGTFTVYNTGLDDPMAVTLEYESDLFTVDHDDGVASEVFLVTAFDLNPPLGTYYDTILVRAERAINTPQMVIVQYNVIPGDQTPEIVLTRTNLTIPYQKDTGPMLVAAFQILNKYGGCMEWSIDEDISWLTLVDSAGDAPYLVSFFVEPVGLDSGLYTDSLFVIASEAGNSPKKVMLNLRIWLLRGDVNNDGLIDIGDVTCFIKYLFMGGGGPEPAYIVGDVNCDGVVDIGDLTYLIKYLFEGGPIPCNNPY